MKHLLSSSAFVVLNKELARQVGLKEAILLADLISKEEYFIANGMTDGWFFNTEANIEKDTTLTPYQQRKCLKNLKTNLVLETKRMGIPAKQYFKINEQQVIKLLNNLSATNLTSINKNKEIRIINKLFTIPTISEVEVYCLERKNNIEAESFINFYDSKGWMVGKNKMKDWRACIRTWEMREKKKPMKTSKIDSQINEYLKGKEYL
jgi:hypothetical protein|tara:strand:- start:673 stop:1293 length:621 start_codon:yes stop_codon:yes gene_type:complete